MEPGDKKPVKPGVDDVRRTTLEKKEDSPHKPTTSQPKPISAPPKLYSGLFFYPNDPYLHLTDSPRDIKEDEGSSIKTGTGSVSKVLNQNNITNAATTIVITSTENAEKDTKLIKIPESKGENIGVGEGVDDVNNDQTIKKSINKLLSFEEQKNSPVSHSPALQDMLNSNSPHHQSHQNHFDPNNVGNGGQIPSGTQNSPHMHGPGPVFQSYNTVFVPYIMTPPIPDYYPEMYHSTSPYVPYKAGGAKQHPGKRFMAKGSKKSLELIPGGSMTSIENQPADDDYLLENAAAFLAKDQGGCRRLQRRLENDDEDGSFRRRLFERISSNFDELMVDPFGNYLCQKVIESAEEPEMEGIFAVIGDKILEIAFDCHGTRALQKLIELVKLPQLITMIINQLKGHVIELVQDNNGNHVIQKCLNFFDSPHNQFIYDEIRLNVVEVATHKHGCCVIQRCLDHSSPTQLTDLVNVIVQHTLELVQDQYGNYVVQYVLDLPEFFPQKQQISSLLAPHLLDLSKQKFASNVIEKCLRMDLAGFKGALIRLLSDANKIAELLCDDFANYVIQSCLQCSSDEERRKLLAHIKSKCEKIKGDELGNKIYGKLAKSYETLHYENASGHKEPRGNNSKGGKHGEKYGGGPFGANSANVSEAKSASQKNGKSRKFEQDARTPSNTEIPPFQLSNTDGMNYNNQGGFPSGGFQMPYPVPMQGYFPQNCVYAPSFMMNNQVINQFYNVPQQYQKWNYQGKQ